MSPLNDLLKEYIRETAGDEGLRVADLLIARSEATDSDIAETLEEKPSHVRKVLYDLYEARIAEYHKEKDKETGWLTFFWYLTPEQAEHAIQQQREKLIGELEQALQFEESHDFFTCPSGGERFDFEDASEVSFHCPEHGDMLDHVDENHNVRVLQDRIQSLRKQATAEDGA